VCVRYRTKNGDFASYCRSGLSEFVTVKTVLVSNRKPMVQDLGLRTVSPQLATLGLAQKFLGQKRLRQDTTIRSYNSVAFWYASGPLLS
jgi:hypothetical protein